MDHSIQQWFEILDRTAMEWSRIHPDLVAEKLMQDGCSRIRSSGCDLFSGTIHNHERHQPRTGIRFFVIGTRIQWLSQRLTPQPGMVQSAATLVFGKNESVS